MVRNRKETCIEPEREPWQNFSTDNSIFALFSQSLAAKMEFQKQDFWKLEI